MATVKKNPQSRFDETIIENGELEKKLEAWDRAEADYVAADVGKVKKARDDAKKEVVTLLSLGETAQTFRVGEHTIDVSPPGESTTHKRTPNHRVTIKRVED